MPSQKWIFIFFFLQTSITIKKLTDLSVNENCLLLHVMLQYRVLAKKHLSPMNCPYSKAKEGTSCASSPIPCQVRIKLWKDASSRQHPVGTIRVVFCSSTRHPSLIISQVGQRISCIIDTFPPTMHTRRDGRTERGFFDPFERSMNSWAAWSPDLILSPWLNEWKKNQEFKKVLFLRRHHARKAKSHAKRNL